MTQENNNMGRFFDWLSRPLSDDDIYAWFMANNINHDLTELFRDFCFSLLSSALTLLVKMAAAIINSTIWVLIILFP